MKSVLQTHKSCLICGKKGFLHVHHVFGGRNRKKSEKYGMKVYLCPDHHNMSEKGVHFDPLLDLSVKKYAQKIFEENHSHEEFMKEFGRNYL